MKKFNWIDALIIILILAVGVGGYAFLQSRKAGGDGSVAATKRLQFQFETSKNLREIAEQFQVGTNVVFGEKKVDRGIITAVEVVPFKEEIEDKINGEWKMEPIAGKWNAVITVEFDGYESENAFMGSQEQVMVGKSTIVEGKGVNSEGYIISVGVAE